jgi:hypothetical protein
MAPLSRQLLSIKASAASSMAKPAALFEGFTLGCSSGIKGQVAEDHVS